MLVALASDVIEWTIKCPLLAQSGHAELRCTCPLSGGKADIAVQTCAVSISQFLQGSDRTPARGIHSS
ncbi:MAG: hypothetical protein WCC54_12210, partial [Pseudolabrys sp.]